MVCVDVFRVVHTDFCELRFPYLMYLFYLMHFFIFVCVVSPRSCRCSSVLFRERTKMNIDSKNALRNEFSFSFNPYQNLSFMVSVECEMVRRTRVVHGFQKVRKCFCVSGLSYVCKNL